MEEKILQCIKEEIQYVMSCKKEGHCMNCDKLNAYYFNVDCTNRLHAKMYNFLVGIIQQFYEMVVLGISFLCLSYYKSYT